MTSLITIPDTTALHLPARGVPPVPLAHGDLSLLLLPASDSSSKDSLSITVGKSTFVLAPNSPVQRTRSNAEHPSFIFTPAPVGGQSIGQVRIDVPDSTSPEAWERTNAACAALEAELKAHGVWESKTLFVDDEYETDGVVTGPKVGWGESIASAVLGGASSLVGKLTGKHEEPALPTAQPVGYHQPQDFRSMATESLKQATIAAKGVGSAAYAVGSTLGQQAKSTIEGYTAPAVPDKDAPPPPAKESTTSATAGALDAPAATSAPAVLEDKVATKAEESDKPEAVKAVESKSADEDKVPEVAK